jgi:hypothetical protein
MPGAARPRRMTPSCTFSERKPPSQEPLGEPALAPASRKSTWSQAASSTYYRDKMSRRRTTVSRLTAGGRRRSWPALGRRLPGSVRRRVARVARSLAHPAGEGGRCDRVRGLIEEMICGELDAVLSRPRYGRRAAVRTLTGTFGKTEIAVPRARLNTADGKTTEWKTSHFGPISVVRWPPTR